MSTRLPSEERPESGPAPSFETLRELTRHGYAPDPAAQDDSQGLVLRHSSGPDLVLRPDGTLRLPTAQPLKGSAPAPAESHTRRRLSRRRTALFVLFAVAFWILSLMVTIGLTAE